MTPYRNKDARSFAAAVPAFLTGKDTPRDFLERVIATIDAREPEVKAWVTLNLKAARKAADESTRRYRAGAPLSPVDGCPIGVKDIIATADMPTQMNSPVFRGWKSGQDAACVQALREAGAIILGKTVTTEFAIGYSGPTTNPHDPKRTPGGSSSGTAAAVGCGMIPVGLGTQTQGSTLRPASYCGAVGFKGTLGVLPLGGVHPLSVTHDHLGVIGATLADVWRVASVISLSIGSPGCPSLSGAGAEPPAAVRPRRLIRLHTKGWDEVDARTRETFESLVTALRAHGVGIIDREVSREVAELEHALDEGVPDGLDMIAYEMKWPFSDYVARWGDAIGERIRGLITRARDITPARYEAMLENRRAIRARVRQLAQGTDGYLTLSASSVAPVGHAFTGSRAFLAYWSWTGFPAFSLPLMRVGKLPIGAQLLGMGGEDGRLAAVANWMTRDLGG